MQTVLRPPSRPVLPVLRSAKAKQPGLTLVELLVTLVILSILASAALPYAEITIRREKELELRHALRAVRSAIDEFHADWKAGRIPRQSDAASEHGYPKTLAVLTAGVDLGTASGERRRYLRRVPRDPFGDPQVEPERQWLLNAYADRPDAKIWGGVDVYDLRSQSGAKAIDGTAYRDW